MRFFRPHPFPRILAAPALAAALLASPPARAEERDPEADFRVLTHNVYLGFNRGNAEHHARWLEWIAENGPDVVSLQELNGYTAERLAEEARAWGHPHSVILKEEGFPTGLTSRWPIEEVAILREGFHHGLLRGRIRGVTVYVVHFHPANWEFRIREAELLAADIASLPEEEPLVLLAGDFNGFSPDDRAHYEADPELVPFFERLDARSERARNLNEGRIDYGGIEAILAQGFVDLHVRFRDPAAPFLGTFPSELVSDEDHGPDRRLDYLFANEALAPLARGVRLLRDEETARFSDHFPLYADFALGDGVVETTTGIPAAPFVAETIDGGVEIGYGLAVGDIDGDGHPDILLADKIEHVWYRNPGTGIGGEWPRHLMARRLTFRDNVCIAAEDITGDGQVEVAVGGQWNPGETSDPAQSGSVHFLLRPEDPTQLWKAVPLPHDPTVHRMGWTRDDAGAWRLLVLPLHGIGNRNAEGENGVRVRVHTPPAPERFADPAAWGDAVIDDSLHATHNFDFAGHEVLVGGAGGILRKSVSDTALGTPLLITPENSEPPIRGVGEIRLAEEGFIAAIEPMHGNEVVVYEAQEDGSWRRTVLDDGLHQGHALAVGDLLGLGHEQVVAGWRNPDAEGKVGIRLYHRLAPGSDEWVALTVDDDAMACEDLKLVDLDGDGRLDIVAAGRATNNLVVYWNRSGEAVAALAGPTPNPTPSPATLERKLVRNPSFENAAAEGLVADDWSTRDGIRVERRTDGGRSGEAYVRFHDDDPAKGQFLESHRVPARPGGEYTASAWLRTSDDCRPGVYVNFYDLHGVRIAHRFARLPGPTEDWQRVEVVETAPAETWEVAVAVYAYAGDVGAFDADDASLKVEGGEEPGGAGLTRAEPGGKELYEIGGRREWFVDDFLIDGSSGSAERRLHHPQPREVALELDQPWEGDTSAYFALVEDGERILLYYRGQASPGSAGQVCCVAESRDGIHFERVPTGLFEIEGAPDNNVVWMGVGAHNFTPFLDTRTGVPEDERFKAVGYSHQNLEAEGYRGRGLGVFASPDGIHWRELLDRPAITDGAFDSQNVAFYDPERGHYVGYHRKGRHGVRDIMTTTSADFREWSDPVFVEYADERREHLYTNGILPYPRAPHLYLGLPARFVPGRFKVPDHRHDGASDGVLMSSRDGLLFERWSQAFIRPGAEPEVWTDRNNFPAWGLLETAPGELSVYWTEHYRHPGMRLRRGTLRADGFVSLHASGTPGEILTRPLRFEGSRLLLNYATDANGWIRLELCDEEGRTLEGFSFYDFETLFGNEIEGEVRWSGGSELSSLAGQSVRLRIRLDHADLYAFRFAE